MAASTPKGGAAAPGTAPTPVKRASARRAPGPRARASTAADVVVDPPADGEPHRRQRPVQVRKAAGGAGSRAADASTAAPAQTAAASGPTDGARAGAPERPPARTARISKSATTAKPAKTAKTAKTPAPRARPSATSKQPAQPASEPAGPAAPRATAPRSARTEPAQSTPTLPVRVGEQAWTADEIAELRHEIEADIQRALVDLRNVEEDLQGLIWDGGDGSGDDQADAGAKTYEREQEISLANISRDKLAQNRHALERLDDGSYGICEACGEPIGKFRLQAAPRATLCRSCKEKAERG